MTDRKRKQMASLLQIRNHKEKLARTALESEISDLRKLYSEAKKKDQLVAKLQQELDTGLEDRLLKDSAVTDPGARFTTFAMTINAARENLLLEEGLAGKLQEDLTTVQEGVALMREDLKDTIMQVKKAEHVSQILEDRHRQDNDRAEEATLEEIANSSFMSGYI